MRVAAKWEGFSGAPGYTNLFFRDFSGGTGGTEGVSQQDAQAAAVRVRQFFETIKGLFPEEVRITVQPDVDVLEDSTGSLVDSYGVTPGPTTQGTSTAAFSGPVGLVINWKTGGIRNGRRIKGRTFLVPAANIIFSPSGGVIPGEVVPIQTAARALIDTALSPDLGVWARPTSSGASDGQWSVVTSASVPVLAAVLRSRRD